MSQYISTADLSCTFLVSNLRVMCINDFSVIVNFGGREGVDAWETTLLNN